MKEKDNCEICHGERGGVKGNEQWVHGVVMCDDCHADTIIEEREKSKKKTNLENDIPS